MDTAITDPTRSSPTRLRVTLHLVTWETLWAEARELMRQHAKDFNISDLETYVGDENEILKFQTNQRLICIMAKAGDLAAGHMVWILGPHPGIPASLVARLGPWYLAPKLRSIGLGRRMFELAKLQARVLGAGYMLTTLPVRGKEAQVRNWLGVPMEKTWLLEI